MKEKKNFKPGQKYSWVCWFTGGTTLYTVSKREKNTLIMKSVVHELDGIYEEDKEFEILSDENGNEMILMTEYQGNKGYIFAE